MKSNPKSATPMKTEPVKDTPSNPQAEAAVRDIDPTPLPIPNGSTCAEVANAQNATLTRKCSTKVNLLSCRCSGCKTDDKYPVLVAASDAPLLNTAYDGSGGALTSGTDLHWEVGNPSNASSWTPATVYRDLNWVASPFGNANWISNSAHEGDDVYFRYKFNLGSSVDPNTFVLAMDFYADNRVWEIYVNGVPQSTQPNGSSVLPQFQGIATNVHTDGYKAGNQVKIKLDRNWRRCENEIIVHVRNPGGPVGFLAQNAVKVSPDVNPCDCHCDCVALKLPDIHPCISVRWGDSPCDCIETDDVEVACVTVCNCYSNVTFSDLSIGQILVTDLAGNPVPNLPDGTPSVQVLPTGPICFGDVPPCKGRNQPGCVSREIVIYTRGAIGKNYRLVFRAICFKVCHQLQSEQCFIMTLCKD
jgi:hypothetical protein